MRITLIIGADGAPFAHDLTACLDVGDVLTVIAPTISDHWSAWLKASPDLDALLTPPDTDQTYAVADQLRAIEYSPAWQRTSDQTIAHRLVRSELLGTGYTLSEATLAAASRAGLPFRLLPMSDDRAELHVVVGGTVVDGAVVDGAVVDGAVDGVTDPAEPHAIHISEYLADPKAFTPTETVLVAEAWSVSPAVTSTLAETDVLILGPSSRTMAIDPVLRTPGLLDAVPATAHVLVVETDDEAPADLVRVAGLRADDPPRASRVSADPATVADRARGVVTS